ncbi:hypothetical protein IBTHAUMO2_1060003 [Nitrosopumilaceae archaeon]|nr:hypothetical protein [Alphaproteobacteria bacterium]CAI9830723.1 hypothetical protein IBTHAUMO2_1060003 [Nitrosopumilaceae archaeon]
MACSDDSFTIRAFLKQRLSTAHYMIKPLKDNGAAAGWASICERKFDHDAADPFMPCGGDLVEDVCEKRAILASVPLDIKMHEPNKKIESILARLEKMYRDAPDAALQDLAAYDVLGILDDLTYLITLPDSCLCAANFTEPSRGRFK